MWLIKKKKVFNNGVKCLISAENLPLSAWPSTEKEIDENTHSSLE